MDTKLSQLYNCPNKRSGAARYARRVRRPIVAAAALSARRSCSHSNSRPLPGEDMRRKPRHFRTPKRRSYRSASPDRIKSGSPEESRAQERRSIAGIDALDRVGSGEFIGAARNKTADPDRSGLDVTNRHDRRQGRRRRRRLRAFAPRGRHGRLGSRHWIRPTSGRGGGSVQLPPPGSWAR